MQNSLRPYGAGESCFWEGTEDPLRTGQVWFTKLWDFFLQESLR